MIKDLFGILVNIIVAVNKFQMYFLAAVFFVHNNATEITRYLINIIQFNGTLHTRDEYKINDIGYKNFELNTSLPK